jgi:putative transposase
MRKYHRVHVRLGKGDRQQIAGMLSRGRESARVLRRALILRQLAGAEGGAWRSTVWCRRRCEPSPVVMKKTGALREKPRPGKQPALDARQSQRIIAMVCGPPPEGRARWTVRLIAEEAVKRKLTPGVGRETIRILLESHDLKPWREKNVVRGGAG